MTADWINKTPGLMKPGLEQDKSPWWCMCLCFGATKSQPNSARVNPSLIHYLGFVQQSSGLKNPVRNARNKYFDWQMRGGCLSTHTRTHTHTEAWWTLPCAFLYLNDHHVQSKVYLLGQIQAVLINIITVDLTKDYPTKRSKAVRREKQDTD